MPTFKSLHILHAFYGRGRALFDPVFETGTAARVKQVHGATCLAIDRPFAQGEWIEADALVTRVPGLPIGVITADCVPVLLCGNGHDGRPVIGAAHAGWAGALGGVLENTLATMDCPFETVEALIGPAIGFDSYEVSKGFEEPFLKRDREAARFFRDKNADKLLFDLKNYCAWRLEKAGARVVFISDADTLRDPGYHSHRGGAGAGERNLSAVMIRG